MHLSSLELWTWFIGFTAELTLMTVLVTKKRYSTFPWFTSLLGFEIAEAITLFLVHKYLSSHAYAYTYWGGEIFESLIRVGVMVEIARITSKLIRVSDNRHIKHVLACLAFAAAVCLYFIITQHGPGSWLETLAVKTSVCTSVLGGFLVIGFVAMTFFEGVRIRVHSQAIAYGTFFYFSGKMLLMLVLLVGEHDWWLQLQDYLKPVYIICLFAWSLVFLFDDPKRILSEEMDRIYNILNTLERMNQQRLQEQPRQPVPALTRPRRPALLPAMMTQQDMAVTVRVRTVHTSEFDEAPHFICR